MASLQKREDWLERNREDYEAHLRAPLHHFAGHLKSRLSGLAPGYHFPQKGLGRLKRSAIRARESGSLFKDWVSYSASRPAQSRFDHNPNLFFLLQPGDPDGDQVLIAGGLYLPSSRQVRTLREAVAQNPVPFEELFRSKSFSERFPRGFCPEKSSSRVPRGFDPAHPRIDWIRLQAFFVWKPYNLREFSSKRFPDLVADDFVQVLRLNRLLEQALEGRWSAQRQMPTARRTSSRALDTRLDEIEAPRRKMDF